MSTQEEIAEALATGRARRRLIKSDEAWYAAAAVRPLMKAQGLVREWNLGVQSLTEDGRDDGTFGEWSLEWVDLGMKYPNGALQLRAFNDGFAAMAASGFQLADLAEIDDPAVVQGYLLSIGFIDATDRVGPYAGVNG